MRVIIYDRNVSKLPFILKPSVGSLKVKKGSRYRIRSYTKMFSERYCGKSVTDIMLSGAKSSSPPR